MKIVMFSTVIFYFISATFMFIYSLAQSTLVFKYIFRRKKYAEHIELEEDFIPTVTIQLPIFNEKYVVERLIDQVCKLNYPEEKLEIQVLDDSTDDTVEISKRKVDEWKSKGIDIKLIHRTDRKGYKAGALEEGLAIAKGEFLAIFDADFLPDQNFLKRTIPHFKKESVGMVQTRWGHINRNYNILTRLQAFALDAHFTIEQVGRNANDGFINFNGTAGVWRKKTIVKCGNWSPDTLTEDLDLSYRAQLKDWEFVYLENVESPAELPPVMSALKSQQYRWTKGGAETAKKHIKNVVRSHKSLDRKWHGVMHLLNSAVFLSIVTCAILSVPLLFIKDLLPEATSLFAIMTVFVLSFVILGCFYFTSFVRVRGFSLFNLLEFSLMFPLFITVSMGLSLHNAIAVIEGYMGKKTSFVRTPKFNISEKKDGWAKNIYIPKSIGWLTALEGLLSLYFAYGLYTAYRIDDFGLFPFHFMMMMGYLIVFLYSTFHASKA